MTTINEFTFMGRTVRIVELPKRIAKYGAYIDGEYVGVSFCLPSSAEADARREVERQDAEAKRKAEPQYQMPPNEKAFEAAEEEQDGDRWELCA